MTDKPILDMLARIDRALLAEIEVLRDGRFDELRDVQRETEQAMQGLEAMQGEFRVPGLNRPRVEAAMGLINRRADQARGLIAAALHGARDARNRLDGLARAEGQVGAYDRTGGQLMMKSVGSPYNKTL